CLYLNSPAPNVTFTLSLHDALPIFTCKVRRTLVEEQTEYQHMAIVETEQFGRMLLLDGMVQTTEVDEFVYHEMITHVADELVDLDRKSTRLNSSHVKISYAVFCL